MSAYTLQKMIRDVNRFPERRAAFFASREAFVAGYALTDDERDAMLTLNIGKLYALGVHGLILRPFTILHKVPEPDYLAAIRGAG
jgi:hypothetical protein